MRHDYMRRDYIEDQESNILWWRRISALMLKIN